MGGIPLCILRNSEHSYISVVYYIVNGENTLNLFATVPVQLYLCRFSLDSDFSLS